MTQYKFNTFDAIVEQTFAYIKQQGIQDAELSLNRTSGFSVSAREGDVETLEHSQGKTLQITLFRDQRCVSLTTSDLSLVAIQNAVDKALLTLPHMNADPCAGLADSSLMAYEYPDLDLYHHWELTPKDAIDLAIQCETLAKKQHPSIQRAEDATVASYDGLHLYANTHGFLGQFRTSHHSMSCSLVAESKGQMQRDHEYTSARDPKNLWSIEKIAEEVGRKTVERLGARRISTRKAPVIFHATLARGLLGQFISAISGGHLYRRTSFLCDALGKEIFPKFMNIYQEPHLLGAIGSMPFDHEGVKTYRQHYIKDGVLMNYVLGSYSARQLGLQTTGNAGGVFNLMVNYGDKDLSALLKDMGNGFLVTELLGQGVNLLTGDYSRGAFGFWVENGEIQFPVEEVTIAGNLQTMFQQIIAVGNDVDLRGNIQTGSILLAEMTLGGE